MTMTGHGALDSFTFSPANGEYYENHVAQCVYSKRVICRALTRRGEVGGQGERRGARRLKNATVFIAKRGRLSVVLDSRTPAHATD